MMNARRRTMFAPNQGYQNLIANGSLEEGVTGWFASYKTPVTIINTDAKFGSNCVVSDCNGLEKQLITSSTFSANAYNDKIYICVWYKKIRHTSGSPRIAVQRKAGGYDDNLLTAANFAAAASNEWLFTSVIRTVVSEQGTLNCQLFYGDYTNFDAAIRIDGAFAYNLTANGLGSMDKAWCDANIPQNILW